MKYFFPLIAVITVICSCAKEDMKIAIAKQETNIEQYIGRSFSDKKIVRLNGSNRVVIDPAETTDSLEFGDSLHIYYAGYVFETAPVKLFDTNNESVASANKFTLTNPDYSVRKILFNPGSMISGLVNGLYGVREKEHCIILFSAEHGYYNEFVYNIPKLSALIYEIWVEKIIKKEK